MYYIPGWRKNTSPMTGFQSMESAPRDGTFIEICCQYGVAPWYGVFKWDGSGWRNGKSGVSEGSFLSWRPVKNGSKDYIDPTGGAQNTRNYWLQACGYPPVQNGNKDMRDQPPNNTGGSDA